MEPLNEERRMKNEECEIRGLSSFTHHSTLKLPNRLARHWSTTHDIKNLRQSCLRKMKAWWTPPGNAPALADSTARLIFS